MAMFIHLMSFAIQYWDVKTIKKGKRICQKLNHTKVIYLSHHSRLTLVVLHTQFSKLFRFFFLLISSLHLYIFPSQLTVELKYMRVESASKWILNLLEFGCGINFALKFIGEHSSAAYHRQVEIWLHWWRFLVLAVHFHSRKKCIFEFFFCIQLIFHFSRSISCYCSRFYTVISMISKFRVINCKIFIYKSSL